MKWDTIKKVEGITGKYSLPSANTLSIPGFNAASAITPRYSPFNTDGTIRTTRPVVLNTNSFVTPSVTTVDITKNKNEKPVKLTKRDREEFIRQQGEQILANNAAAYESLRNQALNINRLGK